eukprot:gnl/Hemi2/16600_TR5562_c0_g1_i1.p1 gnl/Hemi2/16600_TR5562_c0_g1~~gnl/Hemi2/16600_TR5562_c0_g1_i1.p1  ORF type:complete len:447 (-),score=154.92 gnl/Hemi2/16600_TR5562_c0_g1_i1:346-1686(-)
MWRHQFITAEESKACVGKRCLASVEGDWQAGKVSRVNEDGTINFEPDKKAMFFMTCYYGVCLDDVVWEEDDAREWDEIFSRVKSPEDGSFGPGELLKCFGLIEAEVELADIQDFWGRAKLAASLDSAAAYAAVKRVGLCASALARGKATQPYCSMWWNQTRMGGRDPASVARPVTISDTLAAYGLKDAPQDPEAAATLARLPYRAPDALATLFSRVGAVQAIHRNHCNSPEPNPLVPTAAGEHRQVRTAAAWLEPLRGWAEVRAVDGTPLGGDIGVQVMVPHQGDSTWYAVFNDGDAEARIFTRYVGRNGPVWEPRAPTVAFFFWDLAQTGHVWTRCHSDFRATGRDDSEEGGGALYSCRTDIGLAACDQATFEAEVAARGLPEEAPAASPFAALSKPSADAQCFNCAGRGHFAVGCPTGRKTGDQVTPDAVCEDCGGKGHAAGDH